MSTLYTSRKSTSWIAVHCSATQAKADIGAKEIRQWHRAKGWVDIGYHFVIRRDGTVETGRPIDVIGAHVENFNHASIGICMVGGINAQGKAEDNFTPAQYAALAELLRDLKARYPKAQIQGHRDFPGVKKDCPCFDVRSWVDRTGVFLDSKVADEPDTPAIVIEKGDTLWSIAKRFGTTVDKLVAINPQLDPKNLKVGGLVRLP